MPITLYHCGFANSYNADKKITELSVSNDDTDFLFSKACIVYKYEYLYRRESGRFDDHTPYALPGKDKRMKIYNGFDRNPQDHTPDAALSYNEIQKRFCSLSDNCNLEVIFVKVTDSDSTVPDGLTFLGFDVCFTPDGDGFSAICDCMFLCRWHGCDESGTEFAENFAALNDNGLFDSKQQAERYLYRYLSREWAEMGNFCIAEIYR